MKYFVIHSGSDENTVRELTAKWSDQYTNVQFIILNGKQTDWVADATARIRECGKVIYIVGENSAKSENIQLELNIANQENKDIYIFKLHRKNDVNQSLKDEAKKNHQTDGEYEGEYIIGKRKKRVLELTEEELDQKISSDSNEVELILKGRDFHDKALLLEQYKMFVQTSEDLVNRKQSVNTFYVTLNSLMLSAIVSIFCAAGEIMPVLSSGDFIYWVSAFLSVVGVVICCSWTTLLVSYGDLNASKMEIINCIEEKLALKLYDAEWALLTRRIGKKKYRSFTVKELAVARIFLGLYILIAIACVIFTIV